MRIVSTYLIVIFMLALSFREASAVELKIPEATEGQIIEAQNRIVPIRFVPGDPFYFVISAKEFVIRAFQPSSAKRASFDMILAGKRLKESYLLLLKGRPEEAGRSLESYRRQITKMTDNLQKARSQNQEVKPIVEMISDGLKNHEILLFAISQKAMPLNNKVLDAKLENAVESFVTTVLILNDIRPGIRDRFKSASPSAELKSATEEGEPVAPLFNPQGNPRRIIY